jgi:alpha-N-arabinofuranosidase
MTLRDAVHAAMTFDIFNRHAEKIAMANIAQTINCLHSLFAAEGDKYVRTPVFHVFEMYRAHMNGRLIPAGIVAEELTVPLIEGSGRLAALYGSASVREKMLTVTLTNPSADSAVAARIRVAGGAALAEARGTLLTHADPAAANTFAAPEAVRPEALRVEITGGAAALSLPRKSVASLQLRLA